MSTTLPHGIIQINEGNISWYGDITTNWQLIDSKIGIYDAAIATIPAPANNGTLTINYGGTTIAMFGADDAGNVSADIPAPGDGTLTVTQGGNTLGSFTANQAAAETIDIPAPGDGTLTIQLNGAQVQTFTANQSGNATANIVTPAVNDGTLTIQKNGNTVGTFSANQSTNETVNIEVPTKTSDLNNDSGFITGVSWNDVSDKPTFATVATSGSYNDLSNKPTIPTVNNATLTIQKNGTTIDTFTANSSTDKTVNITVPTNTNELTNGARFITADYAVPLSGGAVMTGTNIGRAVNDSFLSIYGGAGWGNGASIAVVGKNSPASPGFVTLYANDGTQMKIMELRPDGTWTWQGQAVQLISDQRLKQQIAEIDDKLLDAWSDVDLVQFKYNDAVEQKGKDKARLHTGFVVQQIDDACKKHGVDISQYGLYCHEQYPQETEEIEVEQADGTKTKEKKVIREASEHYSLRYTEALIVECKYLRRCVERLTARIEELEKGKEREANK